MLLALLLACAPSDSDAACAAFPAEPTAPEGVLGPEDSCGFWALALGEHLYADVVVTEPLAECDATLGAGLELFSSPIYSAMSNDEPKWTFDVVGVAATEAAGAELSVRCADGSGFEALVRVE